MQENKENIHASKAYITLQLDLTILEYAVRVVNDVIVVNMFNTAISCSYSSKYFIVVIGF